MDKNYYEILGLNDSDKNLSDKEFKEKLKKAYKTAAMKWHPDRWVSGTDEEKRRQRKNSRIFQRLMKFFPTRRKGLNMIMAEILTLRVMKILTLMIYLLG